MGRMSEKAEIQRNVWTLTVLCLLREAPMHPYEMQRLIHERKKDELLDLKRGSLYQNIGRLERAGLIEKVGTTRQGKRPERTVYRLTNAGERDLLVWLRDLLAKPAQGSIPLAASISFLAHLTPEDAGKQLSRRSKSLEAEIAGLGRALEDLVPKLGRVHLIEAEFSRSIRQAELVWVESIVGDIKSGELTWSPGELFPRRLASESPT